MRTRGSVDCDQTLLIVQLSKRGEAGSPDYPGSTYKFVILQLPAQRGSTTPTY